MKYQICVQGNVDASWSDWLEDFEVSISKDEDGNTSTRFTGLVPDQAALRGIMNRLWDLNLVILSVQLLDEIHS